MTSKDGWSASEWLILVASGGLVSEYWLVSVACVSVLFVMKTAVPTGKAIKFVGIGVGKGMMKTVEKTQQLMVTEPEMVVPPAPTQNEHAQKASNKYEETCALIDGLPLDDDEKEAMKIHAKKQLINQMWGLLK